MADKVEEFKEQFPSLESYWRSIILFGRNVATYKFALAQSLMELSDAGKTEVTLAELAVPYSKHLCDHVAKATKQATSSSSKLLDACRGFNDGTVTYEELIHTTTVRGFDNVIDAFHVVNNSPIPIEFYKKDYKGRERKIILTDDIYKLKEIPFVENLSHETESRWNLVETAWELGVSPHLMNVRYDDAAQILFVDTSFRRKDITSARGALDGYQKGKCFYCFDDISVSYDETNNCDVDHFFPHTLQPLMPDINLNGVWNLVLSCQSCNRGANGKFARVPATKYLDRLHRRNEFLISSHHPLRETIMNQTGTTEQARKAFLQMVDRRAINALIHRWDTPEVAPATF